MRVGFLVGALLVAGGWSRARSRRSRATSGVELAIAEACSVFYDSD
jgi:hypothetical protein